MKVRSSPLNPFKIRTSALGTQLALLTGNCRMAIKKRFNVACIINKPIYSKCKWRLFYGGKNLRQWC